MLGRGRPRLSFDRRGQNQGFGAAAGQLVRRCVTVGRPVAMLAPALPGDAPTWDRETLSMPHGPVWRLLIIGAGQISKYLAQMALALDYRVFVRNRGADYVVARDLPGATLLPARWANWALSAQRRRGADPRPQAR